MKRAEGREYIQTVWWGGVEETEVGFGSERRRIIRIINEINKRGSQKIKWMVAKKQKEKSYGREA